MCKMLSGVVLCLLLLSPAVPVSADQYDDCVAGCSQSSVTSCTEQARLSAGNVQEEEELIAACEKSRADCLKGCSDAEAQSSSPPPQDQEQKRN